MFDTWAKIDSEYVELMDNGRIQATLEDTADMRVLEARYLTIVKAVEILRIVYHREFIDLLRAEGILLPLDPSDAESYYRDLDRTLTLAKGIIVEIGAKEAQIKARFEDTSKNEDTEEEDIEESDDDISDMLMSIREDVGYHVKDSEITVYEFAKLYKNLIRKLKRKPTDVQR